MSMRFWMRFAYFWDRTQKFHQGWTTFISLSLTLGFWLMRDVVHFNIRANQKNLREHHTVNNNCWTASSVNNSRWAREFILTLETVVWQLTQGPLSSLYQSFQIHLTVCSCKCSSLSVVMEIIQLWSIVLSYNWVNSNPWSRPWDVAESSLKSQ